MPMSTSPPKIQKYDALTVLTFEKFFCPRREFRGRHVAFHTLYHQHGFIVGIIFALILLHTALCS